MQAINPCTSWALFGDICVQRRAKLREQLDLERYETPSEAEEEVKDGAVGRGVKVYRSGDATTTVTVAPLVLNSDE